VKADFAIKTHRRRALLLGLAGPALVTVTLSACGSAAPPNPVSGSQGTTSCTESYVSTAQLNQASIMVVTATPSGVAQTDSIGAIPFSLTPMRVTSMYGSSGTAPAEIVFRQIVVSGGHTIGGDLPPVVASNHTYLLFLRNWELTKGQPIANQYVAVGCGQAVYVSNGSDFDASGPASAVPTVVSGSSLGPAR
jgi:hypothetical protein